MAKLRLGQIPDDKPVTRTVKLSAALDGELCAYAELYAESFGPVTIERLIPPMLEQFMRADRGFRARSNRTDTSKQPAPMLSGPGSRGRQE
jgi:hypothetical protein